nr:MAG TPA: single-stranded-DNA-specific exonuclease RecJ [Caudoviricetes sp.]
MEINQEALSRYGITYTGEKKDWIKEFYDINIKKTIENGDKVYDYESTFNTDNESLASLRKQYIYPKVDLQFELDKYSDLIVVEHIIKLMEDKKKILIACDYDCDGLTSGITVFKYFNNILKYEYVEALPNQRKNGNGFNKEYTQEILDMNREEKIALIITLDHGKKF